MKLHLNLSLRRAVLAALAALSSLSYTASAGMMHDDATYQTYTDFGQNRGRYVVGGRVNALLSHIRSQTGENGGIAIEYTDGTPSFIIPEAQGMISFNGTHDSGHSTVISPTFIATVLHNGSLDGSFSERTVGSNYALNYEAIDIRNSVNFRLAPEWGTGQYDYMLQRQSKIVTDVTWNPLTTLTYEQIDNLDGDYIYHSGSGTMYLWEEETGKMSYKAGPYTYIIGAVNEIDRAQIHADGQNISLHQNPDYKLNGGACSDSPLPNGIRPGDSGSPTFIYNSITKQYEYIAAQQSMGAADGTYNQARGNVEWTQKTLRQFDVGVDMSNTATVYLNAVDKAGDTISETVGNTTYSTTLYSGQVTDGAGNNLAEYVGVKTGTNTWGNLSYLKDKENWYAFKNTVTDFGPDYGKVISDLKVADQDLFYTQNLVFTSSRETNNIILNATVDLGIGYAEFNKGTGLEKAVFNVSAADSTTGIMFNHAGYVINEGAEVHLRLNNPDTHMTEWRKIGAGRLYIDGTGDTNALLNVGGGGTTYLQQTDGHAAYNVLVNSGAKVVINDIGQIERDLTFGAGGGTLDLNGSGTYDESIWAYCIDWYNTGGETRSGFTINALTEEAVITNSKSFVQLTYKEGGNKTFVGSFTDVAGVSSLRVVYDGGGTWTLNSIHTDISHNNSAFAVNSGKVILSGTNTVHGLGSASATNTNRLVNADDWHYADAAMNVEIAAGAVFELGSHARLKGQIYVNDDGQFIMREAVKHQYEYVEGGAVAEDTYQYAQYYGLHGQASGYDIYLDGANAGMLVQYSEGTTANTTLGEDVNISGKGSLTVDLGTSGGTLTLAGNNSGMRGSKTLVSGGLIAEHVSALGNTENNKWKVQEKGWIASRVDSGATLLSKIDSSSSGILALSEKTETQLDLSNHQDLYVGAERGKIVDYGTANDKLEAVNGQWKLGGGEGTLNVHFLLTGENNLVIGNEWSAGTVHLTNTLNDFSGKIFILGTGNLLTYETDESTGKSALGNARVALSYGNSIALHNSGELSIISQDKAEGIIAATASMNLNLTDRNVSLGAVGELTFTGSITPNGIYRFGGSGQLILDTELNGNTTRMEIDGQGNSGSSVTLARDNAYTGDIVAGGGLYLQDANSAGNISVVAGHAGTFASVNSLELQKGAALHTDGLVNMVVQNLSAHSGAAIRNTGSSATVLELRVIDGTTSTLADGVLNDANNSSSISLVKTGQGILSLEANKSWSGGLTVREGQVNIHVGKGGVGSSENTIHIEQDGTLRVNADKITNYGNLGSTLLPQKLIGTGTIVASGGSSMLLTKQAGFKGKVQVTDNTRLYVCDGMYTAMNTSYSNVQAFDNATIQVDSGSQVRITSNMYYVSETAVSSDADYIIAGTGMQGNSSTNLVQDTLNAGALSIDCGAVITGNVTLADHATIASWSNSVVASKKNPNSAAPEPYSWYRGTINSSSEMDLHYGIKNYLGGTIRGQILGAGKTLTISGKESMTFTADSANTFGNLVIANGNGNNDDKFALQLNGGKAISQVSTALGTGDVTLNDGLILRLAGTGIANQSDVVYTYDNDISVGDGATIQSHNITNRLTGTLSMNGSSLNLATANGGVLELAGSLVGTGSLNVAAGSVISLASSSVIGDSISIIGTGALTLRLGGTGDYTLGGISGASALTLHFDFTNTPTVGNDATWSTLSSSIAAGTTTIALDLNLFNDIERGNYTLISSAGTGTSYQLADDMNGRLKLVTNDAGALVLTVDADNRLFWRTDGPSGNWNSTDANWYSDAAAGKTVFSSNANVMLDESGVAAGNSASSRETIGLNESLTVGTLGVQDAAYELSGSGSLSGKSLTVGNGGDLKLSNTGGNTFSEGVVVNNAALTVEGNTLTAEVRAEDGGSVTLQGSAVLNGNLDVSDAETVIRESTVQGKVSLSGTGRMQMDAAQINGSVVSDGGTLNLNAAKLSGNLSNGESSLNSTALTILSGSVTSDAMLRMDSLRLQDGSLQINAAANIGVLGIAAGKTVTLWNATAAAGADKIIGTLELANGAVLQSNDRDAVTAANQIGTVKLTGASATLRDAYHSGFFEIHNLEGSADSTLNLVKNVTSDNVGVFALGHSSATTESGSRFAGTILVKQQNASTDSNRDVVLLLNHESVAQEATINLASAAQATPKVALGINVDAATIGGLRSGQTLGNRAVVFSGMQASDKGWTDPSQNPAHTLTIDTKVGSVHEFYGQVQNVNLVIDGEGTQKFLGSGDQFTGSLSIQGGTAVFNAASFSMLNNASSLVVGSGTLDVSAIDFTDSVNVIRVDNGRSISFAENSTVAFGAMEAGREYSVFDISGGVLEGWSDLSASNFTIDGVKLSDLGRVALNFGMIGAFSYTIEDGWDLVWKGGAEKQTWNQNESNHVWQTTRPDDITGDSVTTDIGYVNNDNVVFNSDADLELEGNIRVNDMTVAEGVSLKTHGNLTITGALTVGSGVSWSFSGDTSLSFTETQLKSFAAMEVGEGATLTMTEKVTEQSKTSTAFDKVSGAGNVELNLSADNGVGFNFRNITGDITVATGRLQVNTSTFNDASAIHLKTSASQLVFNGTGTELKNDVVLGTSTTIHSNSGCSGTISGVISGSGGLTKAGAGSLTFKNQNTYTGVTSISGGKIIIDTGGEYQLMNTVTGVGGSLEVAGGTTVYSSVDTAHKIATNLRINKGGVFSFDGKGNDHFQAQVSGTITVDGGVLDFGNSCQVLRMFTNMTLSNGAELKGEGATAASGYAAAMEFNNNSTINVTSGDNTISATTRLNGGNGRTLTYNVSEGATLNVTGRIHADLESALGNITKSGAGKATLSARTMLNKVTTSGGEIAVAYTGNDGNTIGTLDGSGGATAAGSLRLKKDAQLNVSNQLWGRRQSSVVLEQGATLTHGDVTFSNKGTTDATLKTSSNNSQYTVGDANWSLTNGHLTADSDSGVTLGTQLVNTSVENAGSGLLTVSNSGNSITDVYASAGDMAIMQQAAGLNLDELVVASQKTVSAYTGTEAAAAAEANVTVSKRAEFGAGAVLNANLTLATGATLEVAAGGLTMGSTLTLQEGLTLGADTLSRVQNLSVGESLTLFSGVDGLTLGNTSYTAITTEDSILASPWFTNLTGDQYTFTYTGTDNGSLSITMMSAAVPEPTTATLSLLALAALAARRRRK